MILFIIWSLVLLCGLFNWFWKKSRYPKPPLCPGALPIIGHALDLLRDREHICRSMFSIGDKCNKNGGVMLIKVLWFEFYVITDPEDFYTAANQCLQKHYSFQFLDPWLGSGLATVKDTTVWRRHRKLLNPSFRQHVIDGFLPIFNMMANKLVVNLKQEVGKGPFEHTHYINTIGLQTIFQTALGLERDEVKGFDPSSYMKAAQKALIFATERFFTFWGHSEFLFGFSNLKKKQDIVMDDLNKMGATVLQAKRQRITGNNENPNVPDRKFKAFMDLALELADKGLLTEKEVWEEVNTMIMAGFETSGNTIMYIMLLLGSHVEVQDKLYEELHNVFGDSDRDVEKEDIPKLVYLEAVIKESLRVYSITPVMLRTAEHDVVLKNYTMPAGSSCLLFICAIHRHPIWGSDVHQFRPERWLDPEAIADPSSAINTAFTGFGVGKRFCLGKNYAMMSMKTTLSHVLRHYRISSDVKQVKLQIEPLLKPLSGHHISLEIRN